MKARNKTKQLKTEFKSWGEKKLFSSSPALPRRSTWWSGGVCSRNDFPADLELCFDFTEHSRMSIESLQHNWRSNNAHTQLYLKSPLFRLHHVFIAVLHKIMSRHEITGIKPEGGKGCAKQEHYLKMHCIQSIQSQLLYIKTSCLWASFSS